MIVSWVFPQGAARTAGRASIVALVLAFTVAVLFPVSTAAGTANLTDRVATTTALIAAGLILRLGRGGVLAVIGAGIALLAAALWTGALWLMLFAAAACLYTASGLVPRRPATAIPEITPEPHDFRDIAEALGTALVLALVVREFGFEAFKIPTGSMEPTILGDSAATNRQGDRLLAFKPMPVFRGPERWEIWVFRFPLYRPTNYIKRIVGIAGDHLVIRNGDAYVRPVADPTAPLRIAAKPDAVQESIWKPAMDKRDGAGVDGYFRTSSNDWTLLPHAVVAAVPAGGVQWVKCTEAFADDFRASFDVKSASWTADSVLAIRLASDKGDVRLEVKRDGATITAPGGDDGAPETRPIDLAGSKLGASFRIGLSASDRIVRVFVDGRQRVKLAYADIASGGYGGTRSGRFEIGASAFSAECSGFFVENDAEYQGNHTWDLGPDDFIALGDNVISSADSREWSTNVVRLKDGREFTAPSTARIRSENVVESNFRETDAEISFFDSYGVPRKFRRDELAEGGGVIRGERRPFVNRGDLVGPAFLVFWPVPPKGDFRPRIVR